MILFRGKSKALYVLDWQWFRFDRTTQQLYVLSTAWAMNYIAVVQLSDPVIWFRSWQSRDCRRLVMDELFIRRYFTFVVCWEDFFVSRCRFKINNGRWSDISEIRIPETNPFGQSEVGLRTGRVLIALSQPCIANLF